MCLTVRSSGKQPPKFKKAAEDIKVYKVLRRRADGMVETPYYMKEVLTDNTELFAEGRPHFFHRADVDVWEIGMGIIHSFAFKRDANHECMLWSHPKVAAADSYFVAPAIIPKGTKYIEGSYGLIKCYGSEKIVFNEEI